MLRDNSDQKQVNAEDKPEDYTEAPSNESQKTVEESVSLTVPIQEESEETAPADPQAEIQQLRLELDEYKNLFLRKAAEFENFKKRRQQEFAALINSAEESLIAELLPVLDDFDRLLASVSPEESNNDSFIRGAQLMRDKLMDILGARGLRAIDSVGHPFDPELHEALMEQKEGGTEPGMVLQEHLRGYRLGEKVIRHAQVVVSG